MNSAGRKAEDSREEIAVFARVCAERHLFISGDIAGWTVISTAAIPDSPPPTSVCRPNHAC